MKQPLCQKILSSADVSCFTKCLLASSIDVFIHLKATVKISLGALLFVMQEVNDMHLFTYALIVQL